MPLSLIFKEAKIHGGIIMIYSLTNYSGIIYITISNDGKPHCGRNVFEDVRNTTETLSLFIAFHNIQNGRGNAKLYFY